MRRIPITGCFAAYITRDDPWREWKYVSIEKGVDIRSRQSFTSKRRNVEQCFAFIRGSIIPNRNINKGLCAPNANHGQNLILSVSDCLDDLVDPLFRDILETAYFHDIHKFLARLFRQCV